MTGPASGTSEAPRPAGPHDTPTGEAVLTVEDLRVTFDTERGPFTAVDGISFALRAGRVMGLVGESGCGKSVTALAVMGLLPPAGRVTGGTAQLHGMNLMQMTDVQMRAVRGNRIAMIFQEPMTALNPVFTVGDQIAEVFQLHLSMDADTAWHYAVEAIERVGIPDPDLRAEAFPHQLSGGMRQRAMIAMALACRPDVLIADEPTTALDTTVQAQILDLVQDLQEEFGMAVLFISHNLGVVSEIADDVSVMYAGRVVESAPADAFFDGPLHPYSQGMLATLPRPELRGRRLPTIPGTVPDLRHPPPGCRFRPRCPMGDEECEATDPDLESVPGDRAVACLKAEL